MNGSRINSATRIKLVSLLHKLHSIINRPSIWADDVQHVVIGRCCSFIPCLTLFMSVGCRRTRPMWAYSVGVCALYRRLPVWCYTLRIEVQHVRVNRTNVVLQSESGRPTCRLLSSKHLRLFPLSHFIPSLALPVVKLFIVWTGMSSKMIESLYKWDFRN